MIKWSSVKFCLMAGLGPSRYYNALREERAFRNLLYANKFLAICVATSSETSKIRPAILHGDTPCLPVIDCKMNDLECQFHVKIRFRPSRLSRAYFALARLSCAITYRQTRSNISPCNIAGLTSDVSEEVATQIAKKCRRRQPHCHLTVGEPWGTPANNPINLIFPETRFIGLHFCR